ncbi:hypothetical protein BCY86_08365 [Pajaroellobacter abortibovis]|uniref:Uncharacterized protein n=1 Tax=Pajaroellobacter abortibovis TaxID=1882918 RepID=A0A1L6MZ27_9BACT|nr:hypothetical protein BCY86_08365 [Pajaroellobacter abortibovis]
MTAINLDLSNKDLVCFGRESAGTILQEALQGKKIHRLALDNNHVFNPIYLPFILNQLSQIQIDILSLQERTKNW